MKTPLTPLEFLRRARRLHGERIAVRDGDRRWTYEELGDRCDRFSSVLAGYGVGPGDRVVYIAPNSHSHLEGYYAVPQLGAVLVPVNYRLTAADWAYVINHAGATVVCVHSEYLTAIDAIRDQLPTVRHYVALEGRRPNWAQYEVLLEEATPSFPRAVIDEDDPITINYTSGTTAQPKGVVITHRNAYLNSIGTLIHVPMSPSDHYLWTLPMFHANGWTFVWTVTAAGARHVCLRKVDPVEIIRLMHAETITMLCAAPTVLISLANAPVAIRTYAPRGIRILTAGAPPAAATIERIEHQQGWTIIHVYGLTETAPFISISELWPEQDRLPGPERARLKARQGVELVTSGELLVVDEAGHEVAHDATALGEIVVRGNVVMQGYYRDPEATERAFLGGYFHTGDAAVVHPDGAIEIRDRFKDVIISGGENISSVEVEGVLLRHPAVLEVAVVGLPDEQWGEAPHAFVVLKANAAATGDELRELARANLAHWKAPKAVHFVAELPKTATGKIQKYVLRAGRAAIASQ